MRRPVLAAIIFAILGGSFEPASSQTHPKWSPALQEALARSSADARLKTWIFFTDKGANPTERLAAVEERLTPRARRRRLRNRGADNLVDHYDIPVNPDYIEAVRGRVDRIRHASRWLNAVSVEARAASLRGIAELRFVRKLDLVHTSTAPLPEPAVDHPGRRRAPERLHALDYGSSFTQNDQINTPLMHSLGFNGSGVTICMLDAGFNNLGHEALGHLDILATRDFVNGDSIVSDELGQMGSGNHGTYTLSTLAGFAPGQLIGPAWGATFLLAKTENTIWERHIEEDHWVAGAEWADSAGADIITSSLGYLDGFTHGEPGYIWSDMDGNTAITTIGADIAAGRGILVVNSAGNKGPAPPPPNTLVAPSDGDSVLAVGAVDGSGTRTGFSSMGPSADGRIKPDVMAMGLLVFCCSATDPSGYVRVSGTSLSCPLVAGAAALVLQANPAMTAMEVLEALRSTADNSASPDNAYGWGIVDTHAAAFGVTSVGDDTPSRVTLYPAFPNPFNPATTLRYSLPRPSRVVLTVYDVLGVRITTLVDEFQYAGPRSVVWDGTAGGGQRVSSGVYVCRLRAGGTVRSRKMVLLK